MENHEANQEARERAGLPPLPLVESPPRFYDLPSLSNMDLEGDEEDEQQEQSKLDPYMTLASTM